MALENRIKAEIMHPYKIWVQAQDYIFLPSSPTLKNEYTLSLSSFTWSLESCEWEIPPCETSNSF